MSYPVRDLETRLWLRLRRREPNECWPWLGAKCSSGHGTINGGRENPKTLLTHRVAYELLVGPIPPGFVLDHFRMNPGPRRAPCSRACCNPAHLEPVSSGENARRAAHPNEAKPSCIRGHLFDARNTYVWRGRMRICKACAKERRA